MSLAKPLLFATLGAAGLGASVLGQQAAPVPTAGAVTTVRLEVIDGDDEPAKPRTPAPPAPVRTARPAQAPQGGVFGGAVAGPAVGGGFGYFPGGGFGDDPRILSLARKLADADADARDTIRGELKQLLTKSFDDRLKAQEQQLAELEKQLKKLKETISKRKAAKADIIVDRLAAVEKDAKGLGW